MRENFRCAAVMFGRGLAAPVWYPVYGMASVYRQSGFVGSVAGAVAGVTIGFVAAANSIVEAPCQLFAQKPRTRCVFERMLFGFD